MVSYSAYASLLQADWEAGVSQPLHSYLYVWQSFYLSTSMKPLSALSPSLSLLVSSFQPLRFYQRAFFLQCVTPEVWGPPKQRWRQATLRSEEQKGPGGCPMWAGHPISGTTTQGKKQTAPMATAGRQDGLQSGTDGQSTFKVKIWMEAIERETYAAFVFCSAFSV